MPAIIDKIAKLLNLAENQSATPGEAANAAAAAQRLMLEHNIERTEVALTDPSTEEPIERTSIWSKDSPSVRVHGNGGEVGGGTEHLPPSVASSHGLTRLRAIIRLANSGKPLPIYEPSTGHVKVYHGPFCGNGNDEEITFEDIRGASVSLHRRKTDRKGMGVA